MHILIVDDHDLFRQGVARSLLDRMGDLTVSEADCLKAAVRVIHEEHRGLDLVLLDHSLPDGEGLSLVKKLQTTHPLLPVAMLSAYEDYVLMRAAMDAGAVGFIPKSTPPTVLLGAVQLLLSGGVYIPPNLYQMSLQAETATASLTLTGRQEEVLQLLRCGHSNKEIAWRLNIAEATVKAHVTAILKYCGVSSRQMLQKTKSQG